MKMRTHSSSWRAAAPLLLSIAVLGGLAPVMLHRSDNFNNNALSGSWTDGTWGNLGVTETDSRLEFHTKGATGAASAAGVLFDPHGINWKKDFHIEFTYKLNMNSIAAPKQLFVGAALAIEGDFPQTFTGLACGVLRDVGGLWVGALRFQNGTVVDFDGAPITQKTGKVEIEWDYSADKLTVERSGGPSTEINGYYAANGGAFGTSPMAVTLGAVTYNGNLNFVGNNVFIDNFEMDYFKRPF